MPEQAKPNNPEFYLMDRPEADIPAEGVAVEKEFDSISIVPYMLPIRNIITMFLCLGGFSSAVFLFWIVYDGHPTEDFFTEYLPMMFIVMVFLLGVVLSYSLIRNRNANKIGPLLIIEKDTGKAILPRQNQSFLKDQVVHLQVLSVPGTGKYLLMQLTEINLITLVDGRRVRWPIIGKVSEYEKIEPVINELIFHSVLPVMRYRQYKKKGKLRIEIADMRHNPDQDS